MRVIAENKIASIEASSTLTGGYTTDNLTTRHPKKPWKADNVHTGTLLFNLRSGSSGLALFNTNALSIEVSVYDPTVFELEAGWSLGSGWSLADVDYPSTTITAELDGLTGAAWAEWDEIESPVVALVSLQAQAGEVLTVGEAVGGLSLSFVNPAWGITESEKDFSITKQLSNGDFYSKDREIVRTFSGVITEDRGEDFYKFMQQVSKVVKSKPTAWWLVDHNNDFRWVTYARLTQRPQGVHKHIRHSVIGLSWQEVV